MGTRLDLRSIMAAEAAAKGKGKGGQVVAPQITEAVNKARAGLDVHESLAGQKKAGQPKGSKSEFLLASTEAWARARASRPQVER